MPAVAEAAAEAVAVVFFLALLLAAVAEAAGGFELRQNAGMRPVDSRGGRPHTQQFKCANTARSAFGSDAEAEAEAELPRRSVSVLESSDESDKSCA